MRTPFVLLALAACTSSPSDIEGPITGPTYLYTVDSIELPQTVEQALAVGDDLDGSGGLEDSLGMLTASLADEADLSAHGVDMIDGGAIASSVGIETADPLDGTNVGVWYYGTTGAASRVAEGAFADGAFESNPTRTTSIPGWAIVSLPIFDQADPTVLELYAMEIEMVPDAQGGYNAIVRGGLDPAAASTAAGIGLAQMLANDPADHRELAVLIDQNGDGVVTPDEAAASEYIAPLVVPDVTLFGKPLISAAFSVHLVPDDGGPNLPAPADPCFDRVRDGDETDADCGGATCAARCPGGRACVADSDCNTGTCASGTCTTWSCSDGVKDGFEDGVDCGGICTATCP